MLATQTYAPIIGGEERHVQNLAGQLASRGHDVHVATQALDGRASADLDDRGVHIHRLASASARMPVLHTDSGRPHALPIPDPILTRELSKLTCRIEPDVVHAHNWIVNSLLPQQHRTRRPLVMSLHDYAHRCVTTRYLYEGSICKGPGAYKCLRCSKLTYGVAKGTTMLAATWLAKPWRDGVIDRFLPVSAAVASNTGIAARGLPYEVVPNFIPDDLAAVGSAATRRPAELPSDDYIVFVGDLVPDKGVLTLLAAYERVPFPKPVLLLIGGGRVEMPTQLPRGVLLGTKWPHELVTAAFANSIAAVLPSEWADPCPTTVLEAMALGAPLITTPVGGISDMVDDASAMFVPPGDATSLAEAIIRVITDEDLRRRLAQAARARVGQFTAGTVVPRIERIYEQALSEPRRVWRLGT
ncbi:MAG TPA: glycosyltransferase family 4 protein [Solirubrobacteraceae bacterium]|nr:glycosyltransferase family 4 protein [Solirubrobacteraceae bacterium]